MVMKHPPRPGWARAKHRLKERSQQQIDARHGRLPPHIASDARSVEARTKGEALMKEADRLLCESWNERMWSDGEPIDPSPTIDQAVNGGFPWLQIQCARCKTPSDVDLAAMKHPPTTLVHDLASRLRCRKCAKAGRRPSATLLQFIRQPRHPRAEVQVAIRAGIIDPRPFRQ